MRADNTNAQVCELDKEDQKAFLIDKDLRIAFLYSERSLLCADNAEAVVDPDCYAPVASSISVQAKVLSSHAHSRGRLGLLEERKLDAKVIELVFDILTLAS